MIPLLKPGKYRFDVPRTACRTLVPVGSFGIDEVPMSRMFALAELRSAYEREGGRAPFVMGTGQGDGGATIAPLTIEDLCAALREFASATHPTQYGLSSGAERLRALIRDNAYGIDPRHVDLDQVIVTAGGRDALMKWYDAVLTHQGRMGDYIVVGAVPWVSYLHGPRIHGFNVLLAPGEAVDGFVLTTDAIHACVDRARTEHRDVAGLIITTPDNPTGTHLSSEEIVELIECAVEVGVRHVLLDLMYQDVIDPGVERYRWSAIFRSLTEQARHATTLMSGITKNAGASNVRSAHLVCGNASLARVIINRATHGTMPGILGEALAHAIYSHHPYYEHPAVERIVSATAESRSIARREFARESIPALIGQGYYAFISLLPWIEEWRLDGPRDVVARIARQSGVAMIDGSSFLCPGFARFSLANDPATTQDAINRLGVSLTESNHR